MSNFRKKLYLGKDVAFIIRKGALSYDGNVEYRNSNKMLREDIIRHIAKISNEDPVICTTGKASRELFEIREANNQNHQYDFLTVGEQWAIVQA